VSNASIENPVINAPFVEPTRHFEFTDEGITDRILDGRRPSSYFVSIAKPKKKGAQLALPDWTNDRLQENPTVNEIRVRVAIWRQGGYAGVTPTTRRLLDYWTDPERDRPLFFCQIEALETAIYLTEAANRYGDAWIDNRLREANDSSNPGLPRAAFKMATGSGKTVVMAMLIAWQSLNKLANPRDAKFSDAFLVVTPGITIRDRLRVLMPSDPHNYYRERDIVPAQQMTDLGRAKILVTNFHAFQRRETVAAGKLTKRLLGADETGAFTETPGQMVRRVCRELGTKRNIVVLNDEAHHCYRRKPDEIEEKLTGDDRTEAKQRNEEARIWISGIEAVKEKLGVRAIFDLSATPFFLRGSGYSEGTLFPWVVSDFSLIDAIEAGIVKVPRVPVADDSMVGEQPTYRDLWLRIRDDLPKKGKRTEAVGGEPRLPAELEAALHSLYGNYERAHARWEANATARANGLTPPVFIVVCNNTNVSKLVFDHIAGWEKPIGDRMMVQGGALPLFRNDDGQGGWRHRPRTILVDSAQLESGEGMSADFKAIAASEIDEFKADYRQRFPGRDAADLPDEDLLREVMNTVGKPGRLGDGVQCVVSVSMLTEGWDANTVTHVLGVRAFGTQLLCEQVVGRALRRTSYAINPGGMFDPEYAEVYGVPFSFIPSTGAGVDLKPRPVPTRVRALEDRIAREITFPRLVGYRYEIPFERLEATFTEESRLALSPQDIPTMTENAPVVGETEIHTLNLEHRRLNEVAFKLAQRTLDRYFEDDEGGGKAVALSPAPSDRQAVAGAMRHLKGRRLPPDAAADGVPKRRRRPHLHRDRPLHHRYPGPETDVAPLRRGRLHPLRRLRHHPPDLADPGRQMPRLPRCRRHRLVGAEDGADDRGVAGDDPLRQEPEPRLHHPLRPQRRGTAVRAGLHRLLGRRSRGRRPAPPPRGSDRREEEGQGGQGANGADAVGAGGEHPRRVWAVGVR